MIGRPPGARRVAWSTLALAFALLTASRPAVAQPLGSPGVGRVMPEARFDLIAGRAPTAHAGGGLLWPVGRYVRLGVVAGAGVTRLRIAPAADGGAGTTGTVEWRTSARGEMVARFVLERADPDAWRLFGGGGVGMRAVEGARPLARAFVALGVEHGAAAAIRPSLEIGLGGGMRVGVALRGGRPGAR